MTLTEIKSGTGSQLPLGWRCARLQDVIIEAQPGFACGARSLDGVIQLRMNNVDTRGNFVWSEFIRVPTGITALDKYRLDTGDILFNNTNSTELVGKSALFQGYSEPVVYSNHFTRIRVNTECASPEYIATWLIWQHYLGTFANLCNRWIGQSAVKNDKLLSLDIPLPSTLAEQKRIAAILSEQMVAAEKARAAAEARLEAAKALPVAYLRAVFKSTEAKEWRRVRLGDVFDVKQGVAMSPSRRQGIAPHPFLRTLNVLWGSVDLSNLDKMDFTDDEVASLNLRNGDLLVCEGGDVGRTAIWRGELNNCLYQNHIHRLRRRDDTVIPDFYVYWMQAAFKVFQLYKGKEVTTTIPNLSGGQLKSFLVPLPTTGEQKHITSLLSDQLASAGEIAQTIQQEAETINALPAALFRRAFTGGL